MPESKVGPGPTSNEKFNARAVRLALEDAKSASTVARERRHLAACNISDNGFTLGSRK